MKTFEHNIATNEIIERQLTEQEISQMEIDAIESQSQKTAWETKEKAKAALLQRLGISADEAKLLLS